MINIDIENDILSLCFEIKENSFVALSGKSGSGKTTLLRVIAGLADANGSINISNVNWLDNNFKLSPQKREIGYVFQDYALFENMSIVKNLLYVSSDIELAKHLLEATELYDIKDKNVTTLSGGQKQRVALCRAMMRKPKLLLLDEPLSALDAQMRYKLQNEILLLHKEFKTTTIMVSHDPSEIYKLADTMIVLENGKIKQIASPKDILLKNTGSQKFSFRGEILEIKKVDVIYVAILAIGQQLVEVVITKSEAKNLKVGDSINISTKAFAPMITLS